MSKAAKPDFIYVSVIAAPPESVWRGLTTAEFTRQYWHNTDVQSDFKVGSPIVFLVGDEVGCEGRILVADHPRELSYSWHFPRNPQTAAESPSRVRFLLEAIPQGTRLTVIHDQFDDESVTREMVTSGWPLVLGGLKTLLETGRAVDFSTLTG